MQDTGVLRYTNEEDQVDGLSYTSRSKEKGFMVHQILVIIHERRFLRIVKSGNDLKLDNIFKKS